MRGALLLLLVALVVAMPLGDPAEKDPIKCRVCKKAFGALGPLLRLNATGAAIERLAIPICEHINGAGNCEGKAPCKDLCVGMVHEFAPVVIEVFFQNGRIGTDQLCDLLQVCPNAPPLPHSSAITTIAPQLIRSNLSDLTGQRNWPQWSRKQNDASGSFIHITDTHLDVQYIEGANAECGEPLCCRARNGPPPAGKRAAGHFGDYACDTSPLIADSLWREMSANYSSTIDFAIVTGDEPPHDIWMQSQKGNVGAIDAVTAGVMTAFVNVPTFFVIGNHAGFPVNTFKSLTEDKWLYNSVADDWAHWLPEDAVKTLRFGGYYAARARPGLWVLAMHTTVLTSDDFWLHMNETATDFTGQLAWVNDTLNQVRALGEKAYIIGHCRPTGFVDPLKTQFYEIAFANQDIIEGYLFGHAHAAELSLMRRNDNEDPFEVTYTAGSVTPFSDLNPGFRLWHYSRDSAAISGWNQYWVDLAEANANPRMPPQWQLRYVAPDYFGMSSLSPKAWDNFARSLPGDESANLKWINALGKGGPRHAESGSVNGCDILQLDKCTL